MLTGLGMAETTPGPLIMVVQFVGFLAGYRHRALPPLWREAGRLTRHLGHFHAVLPLGFSRCPLCRSAARRAALGAALSAVTAAVVGVILNLAVWFGVHVIFRETMPWQSFRAQPQPAGLPSFDVFSDILGSLPPWPSSVSRSVLIQTLLACSLAGVVLRLLLGAAP